MKQERCSTKLENDATPDIFSERNTLLVTLMQELAGMYRITPGDPRTF